LYSVRAGCLLLAGGWWVAGLGCFIDLGLAEYPVGCRNEEKGRYLHANVILVDEEDHVTNKAFCIERARETPIDTLNAHLHKPVTPPQPSQRPFRMHIYTVPAILKSRISCRTCSTLLSKCPCAYCSLVSASRYC